MANLNQEDQRLWSSEHESNNSLNQSQSQKQQNNQHVLAQQQKSIHKIKNIQLNNQNTNANNPFVCNICHTFANMPVISHCGHIYCWKCVKNSMHTINQNIKGVSPIKNKHHIKNNHKYLPLQSDENQGSDPICKICFQQMPLSQMRPIYISGQESQQKNILTSGDHLHRNADHQQHAHALQNYLHYQSTRPKAVNSQPIRNPTGVSAMNSNQVQHQRLRNNIQMQVRVPGPSRMPATVVVAFSNFQQIQANVQGRNNNVRVMGNKDTKDVAKVTEKLQKCLIVSLVLVIIGIIFISDKI